MIDREEMDNDKLLEFWIDSNLTTIEYFQNNYSQEYYIMYFLSRQKDSMTTTLLIKYDYELVTYISDKLEKEKNG